MQYQVQASTIIQQPMNQVWDKLRDLSKAHFYVPNLDSCEIITEQTSGVGASRIVRGTLQETVTQWHEGSGFVLRLHTRKGDGVPPLMSQATFEYHLSADNDHATRLTNTLSYTMKFGIFGRFLNLLIRPTMRTMQKQITLAQRLYYETGEKVSAAQIKALMQNQQEN